jgi:hypothetical protein
MALEACKVCGSLTSTNEEIFIIFGHPAKGNPKSIWFRWIAIILAVSICLPLVIGFIYNMRSRNNSPQSLPAKTITL